MREAFDKSFKYMAELDRTSKDPNNQNSTFSEKINSYAESMKTVYFYFTSINDISQEFAKLVR